MLATNGIGLAVAGIFWVLDEVLELAGSGVVELAGVAGAAELVGVVDASSVFGSVLGAALDGVVELELYVLDGV